MVELHCELSAALRAGTEFRRITEHFGQRHFRVDDLRAVPVIRTENGAAAAGNVAHQIAEIIFGGDDLHLHDRLEQDGLRPRH